MCKEQEYAITVENLGKMYKLYKNPKDKIRDAFNLNFFKKDYYEEFWALRGMDLKIRKGERLGLIGNNGAGKSTLLKLIIGNITPTEGSINVHGDIQALMELGTGFHPEFTGRQNIRASLAYQGLSMEEIREKEEEIIDFSELDDFIDQPIRTYSAGMNARLAFSTATSISPDILVVDEVLGAGDAYFAGKCVERMKKITEESGATVLFVSHDLTSVLQLCDRIIWIDRGTVRMQGNPIDVVKEYTATVRHREELRLKARELKKYNRSLEGESESHTLFRFITLDESAPRHKNKIYWIGFLDNSKKKIASIDVGGPMDNGTQQENYLIVEHGFTNWGKSSMDEEGTYRSYEDIGGKYQHAPFYLQFYQSDALRKGSFSITADVQEDLLFQVYLNGEYKTIGVLDQRGLRQFNFSMEREEIGESPFEKETAAAEPASVSGEEGAPSPGIGEVVPDECSKYEYGNRKVVISNIEILNSQGEVTRILETEEAVRVRLHYTARERVQNPVFVFCIYTTDGKCASQWIAGKDVYGGGTFSGRGVFQFDVERLLLGKGSYVASVGIFEAVSTGEVEAESYHVIDRSIFLEVRQPVGETVDKGICIQPFTGTVKV